MHCRLKIHTQARWLNLLSKE